METSDAALVVDFLNTIDLESGTDQFDTEHGFRNWCRARSLPTGDREEARALRDLLRRRVTDPGLSGPLSIVGISVVITQAGITITGCDAPGIITAGAIRLTDRGDWSRIKICPGEDCGEAFYDRSRNHSRVWCDMKLCGNVAKVRTSRRRTHKDNTE